MTTEEEITKAKFYAEFKEKIYKMLMDCKILNVTEKIGILEVVKLTIHSLAHEYAISETKLDEKPSK